MRSLAKWMGVGLALGITGALAPVVGGQFGPSELGFGLSRTEVEPEPVDRFLGLDLTELEVHPRRVTAPLSGGRTAVLTLDPELQRSADAIMKRYRLPEAGVVLLDVKTAETLVYASHVNKGPKFDFNGRAEAPAASIFKVVTGAALVEMAGLSAETEECYHGGKSNISRGELEDNPAADKWCASLAAAMGRSLNVVFAKLAKKNLSVEQLTSMGGALGFGVPVPFEAVNEPSRIALPDNDPVEFARAAAGFWHSSLSPLAAAQLAHTVANGGVTLQPRVVREIIDSEGQSEYRAASEPKVVRRALQSSTTDELTRMMVQTTIAGSARKAFFDSRGRAFLPEISVAGKTGTLTRHKENRHYTWFVGFAPADAPEVAIAALVVNTPVWRIKGPDLARDLLRAYFADKGRKGVTRP
jgi:cell division protein FtsI/penicillin-binding protein 2